MTDKEKLSAVRAKIEMRKESLKPHGGQGLVVTRLMRELCDDFLSYIDSLQEEPKECMYSKDNYTDEDRKALCDGCEEECRFNKKEESIRDSFEDEVKRLWKEINTGHSYSVVDSYNQFYGLCLDIAEWQKEQLMAKAVDATIAMPYPSIDGIFTQLINSKEVLPFDEKVKVIVIKED